MHAPELIFPDLLELKKAYLPYENPEDITSLYEVKDRLDLWIWEEGYRQVCKRFINYIIKREPKDRILRAFIPVLVFEQRYILRTFKQKPRKTVSFEQLMRYIEPRKEKIQQVLESESKDRNIFNIGFAKDRSFFLKLNRVIFYKKKSSTLRFLFRFAHTFFPQAYMGLPESLQSKFAVVSINSYLQMLKTLSKSLSERDLEKNPELLRDIEITLIMTLESFPPKHIPIIERVGFSVEYDLSLRVSRLWVRRKFYEAHEVLEEIWKLKKGDEVARGYLQGIIRLALAYDHLKNGRFESAKKVLEMASRQIRTYMAKNPKTLIKITNLDRALDSLRRAVEERRKVVYAYATIGVD